jgi:hypothetical protein
MLRDLSWMITETVSTLPTRFAAQLTTFEAYKRRELRDRDAHDLAVQFWDADAIGALEIPRLIKEWREPRQAAFAQTPKTVWRLFNAATEIIKGDLWRLPARTRAIHIILDDVCGLQRNDIETAATPVETAELAN